MSNILVAQYIVATLRRRHGPLWLGSRLPRPPRTGAKSSARPLIDHWRDDLGWTLYPKEAERLADIQDYSELFQTFQGKGLRADSRLGLIGWLDGRYPLTLLERIPSPLEMLQVQCEGRRFVSWLKAMPEDQPIGRHAGPFEFLLHDLEHAHKFYGDSLMHKGQVQVFRQLAANLDQYPIPRLIKDDPRFSGEFTYLLADMNTHPEHMLKFLKAVVLEALKRQGLEQPQRELTVAQFFKTWNFSEDVVYEPV